MARLSRVIAGDLSTMLVVAHADILTPSLCWYFVLHAAAVQCMKWEVACMKVCDRIQKKEKRTDKIGFASSVDVQMLVWFVYCADAQMVTST